MDSEIAQEASGMVLHADGTGNKRMHGQKGKSVAVWVVVVFLLISLLCYRDSLREIFSGLRQVRFEEIAVCAFLAILAYILEGMTISYMMKTVNPKASALQGVHIAFLCEFYRLATLGSGAGIAQIHYLHKNGIEPGNATVVTMIQYMWKKVGILILGGVALSALYIGGNTRGILGEYASFLAVGCLGTAVVIAVFFCLVYEKRLAEYAMRGLDFLATKLTKQAEHFTKWKEQVGLLNRSGRKVLTQRRKMSKVLLYQMGKLLLFYSIPAWLLRGETALGAAQCAALMGVAYLLSGVIPSPSGVGSLEFLFLLFFTKFIGLQAAVPAILVFRFVTWILPFLVGGVMILAKRIKCPFP